jgi:hypothetical protein
MEQNNALLAMQYFKYSTCIEKYIIYSSSKVTIGHKKDRVVKILNNRNDRYDTLNKHELCIKKTYGATVQHLFQYCNYTKNRKFILLSALLQAKHTTAIFIPV